jgi:molybdopterin/thiamine biosynthesis adenylyltransferase
MRSSRRGLLVVSDTEFEPWYQLHPDRLTWELEQFERHNLEATVSYGGRYLAITTELPVVGEPVEITAIYPDDYPYFEPTVRAPKLLLVRHQDPVGLNFCLLEDSDRDWDPTRSAAELIGRNLRALLRASAVGQDVVSKGEADMPEPTSAQFSYSDDGVVLVTEPFLGRDLGASHGAMIVARGSSRIRLLLSAEGIGEISGSLAARFVTSDTGVRGRWVALDTPPRPKPDGVDQWRGIVEAVEAVDPTAMSRLARRLKGNRKLGSAQMLVGLSFLEEGPARGEQRRNWLFVEIVQRRGQAPAPRKFLASQALSEGERIRRIPQLAGLRSAHMIVIGAGSVGAPVALELAKAGVGRLDLVDNDSYDVNNAVRHVLGTSHAGEPKSEAVAAMCCELNPFCDVYAHAVAIGDREARGLVNRLLQSATLVIDTTGAQTVGRFLTERARALGVPLVVSGLTAASHGADVLVVRPEGPCLDCFSLAQERQLVPRPPEGPRSTVTPIGCRHPAFSGAGFEATELAAVTARLAVRVSRLTEYPPSDVNWVVINFRKDPHYEAGFLDVRPCGGHD